MIMEMLRTIYAVFGAPYPMASLVTVAVLGALIFGGVWFGIGTQYEKDQEEKLASQAKHTDKSVLSAVQPQTAERDKGANTMGPVINNSGIVTQGQIGNNTIVNPITRDPNGLYQAGGKVGKVQSPTIDLSNGIIAFQVMHFTEYPDPDQPLEYKNYLIHCAQIPLQEPNTYTGQLSATVFGAQCKIIRSN